MATVTNNPPAASNLMETLSNSLNAQGTTGTSDTNASEDRFLKLLVAQMNNQDPLNPLDNAQVTSQLAQINTVRGIEKLNDSLSKMLAQGTVSRVSDAVGMIGKLALVDGDQFNWTAGGTDTVRLGIDLASPADTASVEIIDASGVVADTIALAKLPQGVQSIQWNPANATGAPLASGTYRIRVTAQSAGTSVTATPLVTDRVTGAVQNGTTTQLEFASGTARPADQIKGVFQSGNPSTNATAGS